MSTEALKKLRELTGAGVNDIKKALDEAKGDEVKAVEILRKNGQKIAAKKADRETKEGLIGSYIHSNGKVGVLVAVSCETDFVARTEQFQNFVHDLALQVAATNPLYLTPAEIPAQILEKEKEIYREQLKNEGPSAGSGQAKSAELIDKIIEGKLQKYYAEVCLLNQVFVKDDKMTIEKMLTQTIAKIGENVQIKKFIRFSL